jgi:hypothetical protein
MSYNERIWDLDLFLSHQWNNFNFDHRESNSALPATKKFLTSYCPVKFPKSELKSKNCQNRLCLQALLALLPVILSNCQVKFQALFLMFKHSS